MNEITTPSRRLAVAYVVGNRLTPSETFIRREIEALTPEVDIVVASMDSGDVWRASGGGLAGQASWSASARVRQVARCASSTALEELKRVSRVERRGCLSALRRAVFAARIAGTIGVPDLVHAHFASAPASVARLLALLLDRPWGVSVHARDFYASRHRAVQALEGASYALACSDVLADDLRRALRSAGAATPVYTVHHGLDLRRWACRHHVPSGPPRIVAAGRFVPKKGFDTLLEALALLQRRELAAELQLLGDGPLRRALQTHIDARGLAERVQLGPWVQPGELQRILARAAVFVVPSRISEDGDRDNIANVLIEAYASGVPTVATSLPAIVRLVGDSEASLLVPPDDPVALANAIGAICTDPTLAESLRQRGRALASRTFDQAKTTALLYECFVRHARGRPVVPPCAGHAQDRCSAAAPELSA
jgi:glycosyltransferase involved in cell wall biosynthesis